VIQVAGEAWGTAAEIAEHIGHGLTEDNVRRWATRYDLASVTMRDDRGCKQVCYMLGQAVRIDRAKRNEGRGRPRINDRQGSIVLMTPNEGIGTPAHTA
jgi:hypothetical protein